MSCLEWLCFSKFILQIPLCNMILLFDKPLSKYSLQNYSCPLLILHMTQKDCLQMQQNQFFKPFAVESLQHTHFSIKYCTIWYQISSMKTSIKLLKFCYLHMVMMVFFLWSLWDEWAIPLRILPPCGEVYHSLDAWSNFSEFFFIYKWYICVFHTWNLSFKLQLNQWNCLDAWRDYTISQLPLLVVN